MSTESKIYRYEVPVDDQWHAYDLHGSVLHVAGRHADVVEVWALHHDTLPQRREFRVFGTGQPLAEDCGHHIGTVVHPRLVWHLFARDVPGVSG